MGTKSHGRSRPMGTKKGTWAAARRRQLREVGEGHVVEIVGRMPTPGYVSIAEIEQLVLAAVVTPPHPYQITTDADARRLWPEKTKRVVAPGRRTTKVSRLAAVRSLRAVINRVTTDDIARAFLSQPLDEFNQRCDRVEELFYTRIVDASPGRVGRPRIDRRLAHARDLLMRDHQMRNLTASTWVATAVVTLCQRLRHNGELLVTDQRWTDLFGARRRPAGEHAWKKRCQRFADSLSKIPPETIRNAKSRR